MLGNDQTIQTIYTCNIKSLARKVQLIIIAYILHFNFARCHAILLDILQEIVCKLVLKPTTSLPQGQQATVVRVKGFLCLRVYLLEPNATAQTPPVDWSANCKIKELRSTLLGKYQNFYVLPNQTNLCDALCELRTSHRS